jgi:hypothetical protein
VVRVAVGDADERFARAGGGLTIGSITKDAVGAGGLADGMRVERTWSTGGAGGGARRWIVHAAGGATRMNPVAIRVIHRSARVSRLK